MMLPLVALITLSGIGQQQSSTWLNFQVQKYVEWKTLDDLTETVRKDYKLPGLCMAYQMGDKTEASVSGLRSSQNTTMPIEDDDRLLVGSIGKSMTACLIARLIEMQKFGWHTTLADALPDIKMLDAYKGVTIEQLLLHKGKIPGLGSIQPQDLDKILGKSEVPTKLRAAFVAALLTREVGDGPPASSDTDYVVAGYIAERVVRQSYEWLMERYVFNPMKMSTAMIAPIGAQDQVGSMRSVQPHILGDFGYTPYAVPMSKIDFVLAPAGVGVSCSIADLLNYANDHLKGMRTNTKALTAASYRRIHTPPPGETTAMGCTVDASYAGAPCLKWVATDGAFYADMDIWPVNGIVAVAVTNAGTLRLPSPTSIAILAVKAKLEKKE
jgi:CubicO group peptidase (beta-lactamase class C family)